MVKSRHAEEQSNLIQKVNILEMELFELRTKVSEMEKKMTKKVTFENQGVQVTLDVEEKVSQNSDDVKNYYKNINYFVLGGKQRPVEWVICLITDVLACKMLADIEDTKAR